MNLYGTGGQKFMPDEICTACGGTMHLDDFTGTLICSVCGSSRPIASATAPSSVPAAEPVKAESKPVKQPASAFPNAFKESTAPEKKPVSNVARPRTYVLSTSGKNTISDVRVLMGSGQFKDALDRMNKMWRSDKSTSVFLLLSIICGYQVQSTEELLLKVSNSPMAIQKLHFRPDWDQISQRKPGAEDFSFYVREYFALCLIQNGVSLRELRMKTCSPHKGPQLSPLAKLDEEDSLNAERVAQLKSAQNGAYTTLADRMKALENIPFSYYDSQFGADDRYKEEREEIRAMAVAGEIRRQRVSEADDQAETEEVFKFPQVRPNITPEEITERTEELLRLIRLEEQKILE
ncbi:MAG: hypothetical protein IKG93_06460 [Clostridiales bacterium]|nr:hypothetical protein [Clostridiales bacterium]